MTLSNSDITPEIEFRGYEKAAIQGNIGAMQKLAECYEKGVGTAVDLEKAEYWRNAADGIFPDDSSPMTDPNYLKARTALDQADALIEQTEEMLAQAELEAVFEEGEQLLSEIDRAFEMLDRLCDSANFSEKIEAEFPSLSAMPTEELERLYKRQSEAAERLQDVLLKKEDEAYNEISSAFDSAFHGDAENLSEEEAALKKKLAALKKKISAVQQKYHRAKKIANAAKIILCDRELLQAMEQIQDSDKVSKLEAEVALLYKEIAVHSAKSDEYEAEAQKVCNAGLDDFDSFDEESEKLWDLLFSELDIVQKKLNRICEIQDELIALSGNNVEEK